ncbi:hypothetical protein SmJEL517_g00278 [Synchytrium microbalum]|uniref:Flavin-containing monooxygenase n=1 Tax=Synchytrium microbalum TaxID=1806994 RepID=A0A507CID9_9FUNG|nr:uncharacterized protein SmJEL517_g00278 [Synchytrium microbalum]TPX37956.1 hypothetical protein SmJEL517_g00278 [Synchytrium microbalum]
MNSAKKIQRVAIVGGGGIAGLAAIKHLKDSFEIAAFERFDYIGGIWHVEETQLLLAFAMHYTEQTSSDITSLRTPLPDATEQITSAIYPNLVTNLPPDLMSIRGFPFKHPDTFPHHRAVLKYIHELSDHFQLKKHIVFNTIVTDVRYQDGFWIVKRMAAKNGVVVGSQVVDERFDAVVVCNGHYSATYASDIPVDSFKGRVIHSHDYRHASEFKDKVVVVVGAGPSGLDIANEISKITKSYLSVRNPTALHPLFAGSNVNLVPQIKSIDEHLITFSDRQQVRADILLLATGYLYSYPFLKSIPDLITDGKTVHNLYKYLFYIPNPTLAFPGLPMKIEPFTIVDYQCQAIKQVFSGEAKLPSIEAMRQFEVEKAKTRGVALDSRKYMGFDPLRSQVDYHMSLVKEFGGPPVDEPEEKVKRRERIFDERRRIYSHKL